MRGRENQSVSLRVSGQYTQESPPIGTTIQLRGLLRVLVLT